MDHCSDMFRFYKGFGGFLNVKTVKKKNQTVKCCSTADYPLGFLQTLYFTLTRTCCSEASTPSWPAVGVWFLIDRNHHRSPHLWLHGEGFRLTHPSASVVCTLQVTLGAPTDQSWTILTTILIQQQPKHWWMEPYSHPFFTDIDLRKNRLINYKTLCTNTHTNTLTQTKNE